MAVPRQEKAYEKHAWILLFAMGMVGLGLSFSSIFIGPQVDPGALEVIRSISGTTWEELSAANPGVADTIRVLFRNSGLYLLGFSLFGMAVALKSYRRGEKWAWYVSLYLPAFFGILFALALTVGWFSLSTLILLIISLLGLLLPYRKFFPKKQAVTS